MSTPNLVLNNMTFSYKKFFALVLCFYFSINLATASTEFDDIDRNIRLRQYSKAAHLLQPLVRQNRAKAEFMLAGFYRAGKGVSKSLKKAQKLYEKAAQHGSAKAQYTLATLLSKKPPNKKNQQAVLHWYQKAAAQGYTPAQKKLKRLNSTQTRHKTVSNNDIFSLIRTNNAVAVSALIDANKSFDFKDAQSRIPLQVALLAKHKALALSLLKVTSLKSINRCTQDLPLHLAISNGDNEIARYLIGKNAQINTLDSQGNNALFIATRRHDLPIIKQLLEHNANPLLENNSQSSAMQLAQTLAYKENIKQFKHYGFKPKAKKVISIENKIAAFQQQIASQKSLYKGWPLINVASLLGDQDMVLYLLKNTPKGRKKDSSGMSALHRAAASGHVDIVKMLVEHQFPINDLNKKHQTALFLASQAGRFKVVKYLLRKKANSSIYSINQSTALAEALSHGHYKTATLLIPHERDQDIITKAAFSALKLRQKNLSLRLIKKLKLKNSTDKYGRNLLWYAVDKHLKSVRDLLLSADLSLINTHDQNGYSPLAQAIKQNENDSALQLMAHHAALNQVTKEKNTLLMLATLNNNQTLVTALLDKNVSLDDKNNFGNTALMIAAKHGFNAIIQKLLKAGVNSKLRDNNDKNAYQLAVEAQQTKSAQLINQSGQLFKFFN